VIVALQGCVIVALRGCAIVALQSCLIVALQGCVIVALQSCVKLLLCKVAMRTLLCCGLSADSVAPAVGANWAVI
jgi:hypothetical protein